MKWYYIVAIIIVSTLAPLFAIYSMNLSLSESFSVNANVIDSFITVDGNYTIIRNVYNFTVTVYYGNYTAVLYPGELVSFPYQQGSSVILKANSFEEVVKVIEVN
ncbi:hypothetical protein GFS03_03595 [Sulfolobus sp. E5-1-F]|uniref:hypothetical protein n=1 Tax=Sulfolobaceae TaxID=118883 RepID=UPI00129629CC|nr:MULTISPECIES: hypothetical protein [unclassified Sulfolobus]QGA53739.1 hypothetical protein GFS03_03595 [Sulfolobus sp. E5-1-F]QGA68606.1 hypothetical protein GFS33_07625 [Sulfolobus sp. E11-6]